MTERRRHIQSLVCDGRLFALCEENRLWRLHWDLATWIEVPPLPGIEVDSVPPSPFDGAPPTLQDLQDLQDMAHYLAQNPPLPHGNTPPLSASDQQEAPPTTYDQFEDPLA
jgi:hypothetical protein